MLRPLVLNARLGWARGNVPSPDSFDLFVRQFSGLLSADLQLIHLGSSLARALCLLRGHCDSPLLSKLDFGWELARRVIEGQATMVQSG